MCCSVASWSRARVNVAFGLAPKKEVYAGLAWRLAEAIGAIAVVPEYRLAPEHSLEDAIADAVAAYAALTTRHPERPVLLSGEDAGAHLALHVALQARRSGLRPPVGTHLISPLVDLELTADSLARNSGRDPWWSRDRLVTSVGAAIQAMEPEDPRVSLVASDLSGLAPLLIHAAEQEVLVDDARRLADDARSHGVEVALEVVPDSVHSFPLFEDLPETARALADLARFATAVGASPVATASGAAS